MAAHRGQRHVVVGGRRNGVGVEGVSRCVIRRRSVRTTDAAVGCDREPLGAFRFEYLIAGAVFPPADIIDQAVGLELRAVRAADRRRRHGRRPAGALGRSRHRGIDDGARRRFRSCWQARPAHVAETGGKEHRSESSHPHRETSGRGGRVGVLRDAR